MRLSVAAAVCMSIVGAAVAGPASAAIRKYMDIPAEDLGSALQTFAQERDLQLVYLSDAVDKLRTSGAVGEFTADEALQKLLKGTGLSYRYLDEKTVTIAPANAGTAGASAAGGGGTASVLPVGDSQAPKDKEFWGRFRLAQADQTVPGDSPSVKNDDQNPEKDVVRKDQLEEVKVPEVLVQGSKILNVDVKRTEDDVQPYYILDSQQIQQSGAANVEDFLKQQLTMDTTIQSNAQHSVTSGLGTTSTINLRGLGANETLILIDGRRSAGVSNEGSSFQPDINAIPLAAIERIEVLPSSASAIYGGAAMGGVVNVVLKKQYQGATVSYTFDNTTQSNAPLHTVNATYGFSPNDGKTSIMLAGHYSDGKILLMGDRPDLIEQGYSAILSRDPGFFSSGPSFPVLGATPNIGSANGANLTLKGTGASLNSNMATIAAGAAAATASSIIPGQWNYALAPTAEQNGLLYPIGSVPRVKSLLASIRQTLTPTIELFTEFSTESNIGTSFFDPFNTAGGVSVSSSSPANPFNQNVRVSFPNTVATPFNADSVTQSATVGLLAGLASDWRSELDYTWSRNMYEFVSTGGDLTAFNSALASGVVNPFVDTLAHPLDLTPYLQPSSYSGQSTLNDLGLRLSGPVGSFPWGRPSVTIGVEHRKEGSADGHYRTAPLNPADSANFVFFGQSQSTNSVYMEADVPLVTAQNARPGMRSLSLQLAGRSERYTVNTGTPYAYYAPDGSLLKSSPPQGVHQTINYTSTNPTVGFKYQPVNDLTFRVSYAKAFLPPTAAQFLPDPVPISYLQTITDPKNNLTYGVHESFGGNPNLQPQTAEDWDFGVIWEPKEDALNGLRADLEYYRIKQPNYITQPTAQQIVSNPAYASRVTRDPTTGLITVVDLSYLNAREYKTDGWDLTVDYRKPTKFGTFRLHGLGTLVLHDQRQYTIGGPFADYVGYPSEGGETKIKTNATLSWEYRRWTFGWTTTYYGNYRQYGAPGGPYALQNGPYTYYTSAQGGYSIPSQTYHELFGGFDSGSESVPFLSHVRFQFGIKNLFNHLPPLDVYYSPFYYSPYGDPRLRSYWLSLSKSF